MNQQTKIAIIGSGPKAIAIAAKTYVLYSLGYPVPEVHIFEKNEVAANWQGKYGYTNGELPLGTSPEKDIGFPYQVNEAFSFENEAVQQALFQFSWPSYLRENSLYSDWIDQDKPAPTHRQWAAYLSWVMEQVRSSVVFHQAEVTQISCVGDFWSLAYEKQSELFESLILTGPGKIHNDIATPESDRVFTLETFWHLYDQLEVSQTIRVAIVGGGENAATAALCLAEVYGKKIQIDFVTNTASVFSRGESYFENRLFSNPTYYGWQDLSLEERKEFIQRTDLGVFSQAAMQKLQAHNNISVVNATVQSIEEQSDKLYLSEGNNQAYDYVVLATGFSQSAMLHSLFDEEAINYIKKVLKIETLNDYELALNINTTLALNNLKPTLHIPVLAGLMQGPGFPNLSCLGRLSGRVLSKYITSINASLRAPSEIRFTKEMFYECA